MVTVIRLEPENAEALRNLRWEALTLHPTAFTADLDIESRLTLDDWREQIRKNVWFGGIVDGELVAMVALLIQASKKVKHTGYVASMYVRENERGTGLADRLMKALLAHAAECVEQVMLAVEAGNMRAIKFYQRHGFHVIGRIPRSILVDGKYFDELQMFLTIPSARS
ncbi:MAG: GNAT family N-acetyltransferase [Deltaproteobacteria bacterium]|nr:GNAT family N-acetyltransferase [Deltaproteobacteria bacterium]